MLFLQLKDGEYLTIGEDIVIQVFTNSTIRVSVQAPKDKTILRGEVLERNGENRPQGLFDQKPEKWKKMKSPRYPEKESRYPEKIHRMPRETENSPDENLFSNG